MIRTKHLLTSTLILSGAAILSSTALVACSDAEDVGSENVETAGMYALYEVVSDGTGGSEVLAELRVGGDDGTYVELTGDDKLVVKVADENQVLGHESSGDKHSYLASFETDAGRSEFQFLFERGEDKESALQSFAVLPDPFTPALEDLEAGDEVARGTDVTVTWEGDDIGEMNWEIEGDCVWSESGETSDDGSITFNSEDIRVTGTDEGETCDVLITLSRINTGNLDPAFGEGGHVRATQTRSITITSTPGPDEEGGGGGAGGAN